MRESWRRMLALIVRRLVSLIPILLIVSFVVFMLTELVPGDAATTLAGGADATPERIAEVRTQLGLDRPVLERYGDWLVDAVQLDFGSSLLNQGGPSIAEEIRERIPVTFSVALAGLFVSMLIGIPLGILSGIRPGAKVDRASVTATSIGLAIPSFVVALFLITAFAIDRDWFPALGLHAVRGEPLGVAAVDHRSRRSRSAWSPARRSRGRCAPRSSMRSSRTTSGPRSRSAPARGRPS